MGRVNLILGAGITGLTAGIKTGYPIYESGSTIGGLCRSYNHHGYRFERGGGHWFFKFDQSKKYLEKFGNFKKYKRKAGVYYNQVFDYPIQNHFNISETTQDGSLKEWMFNKFGNEMCRLFFYPFNNKYTCELYEEVIQDDIDKSPTKGKGYNDIFAYPDNGLENLVEKMGAKCDVRFNKRAIKIEPKKKIVVFSDGETIRYNKIISTIPLKDMMSLCEIETPDLLKTSVAITNIGAERGPLCPKEHWLYIPDEKVPFFRVGFYSNVDKDFTFIKDGVSIGVETAFVGEQPTTYHRSKVANILHDWNWIGEIDVVDEKIIDTAYTWLSKDNDRDKYIKYLETIGITSTGRYGKWKFQGIIDSINDGLGV